jgi:hypothetical protein
VGVHHFFGAEYSDAGRNEDLPDAVRNRGLSSPIDACEAEIDDHICCIAVMWCRLVGGGHHVVLLLVASIRR